MKLARSAEKIADREYLSGETHNSSVLVTIITIVLNGKDDIERTIDSVLTQDYQYIEYIIIDGGSSDGTLSKIEQYGDRISKVISAPDDGIYNAINKGIYMAIGSIIGILHCGDYYVPGAVTSVVDAYKHSPADVIYGNLITIEKDGEGVNTQILKGDHKLLTKYMSIFHPASFVSRKCYYLYGVYNERYKSASDYDLFLKLTTLNAKFFHIDKVLAKFALGGLSSTNILLTLTENYKIRRHYIGKVNATKYIVTSTIIRYSLALRRWFLIKCIGKRKYGNLKQLRYKLAARNNINS